jgi:hypothetical protein
MCEQQIKNRDAYDKICTKQRTSALTGQHRSDQCPRPVRPVRSSQHTQLGGTGQTDAPDRSDQSGLARAQSKKSVCYFVQSDQAGVASRLRSFCTI